MNVAANGWASASGYGRVLLVERDEAGKQALERALLREGLQTLWARSSGEAELMLSARQPGLIVLNPRLPPEDGWQVYRQLQRYDVPIVVLASSAAPAVQRVAFALGAAACVAQADSPKDIAARVRQILGQAPTSLRAPLAYAGIKLDPAEGRVRIGGQTAHLTPSECAVLGALIEARGRVVPRDRLVHRARAEAGALPLARSIDAHVRALRRKLGDNQRWPVLIESVRGFGYRLAAAEGPARDGLIEAAFAALPEAAFIVDRHGQVKLMNHMAESLVGVPEAQATDCTCAELLHCQATALNNCPALHGGPGRPFEHRICPQNTPLMVKETVVSLPGAADHFLLELREHARD